jgi:hypothetical protein
LPNASMRELALYKLVASSRKIRRELHATDFSHNPSDRRRPSSWLSAQIEKRRYFEQEISISELGCWTLQRPVHVRGLLDLTSTNVCARDFHCPIHIVGCAGRGVNSFRIPIGLRDSGNRQAICQNTERTGTRGTFRPGLGTRTKACRKLTGCRLGLGVSRPSGRWAMSKLCRLSQENPGSAILCACSGRWVNL